MTIGFASRAVAAGCALCAAGLLAAGPAAATARPGAGTDLRPPDGRATAAAAPAALLYRSGTQVRPRAGAPDVPDLSARSWLVADARTGAVLAGHDAHRKLPPASTLKALFALTLLPILPGGLRHTVSAKELEGIGAGSSLVGVAEDRAYRVSDLWNGVFLSSGNDAVHVLSALNGGQRATVTRMQAKARALGARDTRVKSPDGYDAPGQVSSAFDLAVFGRAGLRNPDFARYCARAEARFPGRDGGSYGILNTNRLLTGADGVRPYRGLVGIKNGYTTHAGHTLIAAARRNGRTLVVSVMNPRSGHRHAVYEEARSLLDWGFEAAGRVDPVGSLDAGRATEGATEAAAAAGPQARPVGAAAAGDAGGTPGRPVAWTVAGAALLGAAAVALVLRLLFGPAPRD
ncbi:serine hydrolase [Streptomyces sp. NPDC029526]|uniref:D-alanyl-D-alanine carboxypeptidase family protein n=1 Tax=Streptomyces sp. NPDC029526 TaxID=3155728 RepID=UPI0033C0F91B